MAAAPSIVRRAPVAGPALRWDRELEDRVRAALAEDLGTGDATTARTVPADSRGFARLYAKAPGVLCGAPVAERVFRAVSPAIRCSWKVRDGAPVARGDLVAEFSGPYPALLAGERVALNFLQRMSGIATLTRAMVGAASEAARAEGVDPPAVCDTRKTTPLWRTLERYAVACGGGVNHRFGLFDMVLIKENHARAAGGVGAAVRAARSARGKRLEVAAEARDDAEVAEAVAARADLILLDNMTPARVARVVRRFADSGIPFEVSGGVTLRNVGKYARTGVARISVGGLTHSAPALDLSLQIHPVEPASE